MILTIKKEVEESIELKTPAYFKTKYEVAQVTEDAVLTIWNIASQNLGIQVIKKIDANYNTKIDNWVRCEEATEAEFMNAYNTLMSEINPFINNAKIYEQV